MSFETPTALLEPVAEVRYAFDEQKERAAFAEQVERYREGRDQAFDARLEMGRILLRAQQMWPNAVFDGNAKRYSHQFLAFVATLASPNGSFLKPKYAAQLIYFAKDPARLEKRRVRNREASAQLRARGLSTSSIAMARKIREAIRNGHDLQTIETALTEIIGDAQVQPAS